MVVENCRDQGWLLHDFLMDSVHRRSYNPNAQKKQGTSCRRSQFLRPCGTENSWDRVQFSMWKAAATEVLMFAV